MINKHRGEISVNLDDKDWTLCLTLGALAQLENHFKVDDLASLAEKLSGSSLSASDFLAIILAGLKGGGHDVDAAAVFDMRIEGGATGYAQLVAKLLQVTFGAASPETPPGTPPDTTPKVDRNEDW